MNESYTAAVARNERWQDDWATEPYETAWASEAIFFVRVLNREGPQAPVEARVQISPDGMRWVDEGMRMTIAADAELAATKVSHFGGWLRLAGRCPRGTTLTVMAYLALKG